MPAARTFISTANITATLSSATGDKLLVCTGSKFGMELSSGNVTYTSISQHNPITIGVVQAGGCTHGGSPNGSEVLAIDNAWSFFNNTGLHYTTTAVTDYGNATLDLSGWNVAWNGLARINMGGGLPAAFSWSGVYGDPYTLTYSAIVPPGDPSGFGGVPYSLILKGKVSGGPSHVNATCDAGTVTPTAVVIGVSVPGVPGAAVALNSQIQLTRPDDNNPDLAAAGYSTLNRPDGYTFYKYGVITYTVTGLTPGAGQTATVTMTLPEALPVGAKVYKINSTGYHEIASSLYTLDAETRSILTLTIVDDGPLDDCGVGCTMGAGVIIDPMVIGLPMASSSNATGAATGGSGGCAYNPNGKFDLGMLLALFGSLGYLGWRRARL